jgi:hypothetical protein
MAGNVWTKADEGRLVRYSPGWKECKVLEEDLQIVEVAPGSDSDVKVVGFPRVQGESPRGLELRRYQDTTDSKGKLLPGRWHFSDIHPVYHSLDAECREIYATMVNQFGENRWWLSGDRVEIASHQIFLDRLMVDFGTFHQGLQELIGRSVFDAEFAPSINLAGLREEARLALKRRKMGIGLSPDEVQALEEDGLNRIMAYCAEHGKGFYIAPHDKN